MELKYYGRISKEKGVDFLIKAMKNNDHTLKIAGDGPLFVECENLIYNLLLNNRVIMYGYVENLDMFMYRKNPCFFVLPSMHEGVPYVILDELRNGSIVISSDVGGVSEVIEYGIDGFLFKKNDVNSFNECLDLVQSSDLEKISENAIKKAKSFSLWRFGNSWRSLYSKMRLGQ